MTKMLTIALLATLSLTTGACATETDVPDDPTGSITKPGQEASTSDPDIEPSIGIDTAAPTNPLIDDGRTMWAEVIETAYSRFTLLHSIDSETGFDTVTVLDEDGLIQRVFDGRFHAVEISVEERH